MTSKERQEPQPQGYLSVRAFLDSLVSVLIFLPIFPICLMIGLALLLDVGAPILFRQERIGHNGHAFFIRKFRTHKRYSHNTESSAANDPEMSSLGRFLRKTRLDELPQLLNVIAGDMALIGPRPLLAQDQPPNPAVRLSVRPGITGWAQIHGGTLLTALEKRALDEWYVQHASVMVDLQILLMTLPFMIRGERRSEPAIAAASALYTLQPDSNIDEPALEPSMS